MKQKSLRQFAKELEVSPSYLSMIITGQRKCPEKLRGALSMFTNVHKPKLNPAWKAVALVCPAISRFFPLYPCPKDSPRCLFYTSD